MSENQNSFTDEYPWPVMSPTPKARRPFKRAGWRAGLGAGILAFGAVGGVIGHVAFAPTSAPTPLTSTGGSSSNGHAQQSPWGNSGNWGTTGPGFNGSGSSSGSEGDATGAPADTAGIAKAVSPSLVDINTNLSYQQASAAGTGIVLSASGEILTNNHVIAGATSISVTNIGNGKTYGARVVGYDTSADVAVIKLKNASGLSVAKLGNSATVRVGDGVVGVGNAGGRGGEPSYAGGSVTALGQSITASDEGSSSSEQLKNMIGTNANIQPGDSGGPLVNAKGEVIGIDTAGSASSAGGGFVFQQPGATSTRGYAIPINDALSVVKKIEAGKQTSTIHIGPTAFLGVQVESVSAARSAGLGGLGGGGFFGNSGTPSTTFPAQGAVVAGIVNGSPADGAGLSVGDTIVSFNGKPVSTPDKLRVLMIHLKPGDSIQLSYVDGNGASHSATLKLASGPPQ